MLLIAACAIALTTPAATARDRPHDQPKVSPPSVTFTGMHGLITTPSARKDRAGTLRLGVAALDPYLTSFLGVQVTDRLYINLRQSGEISSLNEDARRLYPGLDFKLNLLEETSLTPALALGVQSALGHKRMAGEYLVASKKFGAFDFSGGIAWGRLGSAAHAKNPFSWISDHFDEARRLDGPGANGPEDWFTGPDIGFFAGLDYQTPLPGLSLQAEWGADRFRAEQAAIRDYDTPAPWSVGLRYTPREWVDTQLALAGGNKFMARLSVQAPVTRWPLSASTRDEAVKIAPRRLQTSRPAQARHSAAARAIILRNTRQIGTNLHTDLHLQGTQPPATQVGRAARHLANAAGRDVEILSIHLHRAGLKGPVVDLVRADLERAVIHHQGSPAEIGHNADFRPAAARIAKADIEPPRRDLLSLKGWKAGLIVDQLLSLSEEDESYLYRTSVIPRLRKMLGPHSFAGVDLRINLADNLEDIRDFRPVNPLPVRSDIDRFSDEVVSLDRLYTGRRDSWGAGVHTAVQAGYLEEMYAGMGGEILYRPHNRRYALGAELYQALRRDPESSLNLSLSGDSVLTGHINFYYRFANPALTIRASAGHYLAGDPGAGVELRHVMDNGARLEAYARLSRERDFDPFGGTTHLNSGLRISVPIGTAPYIPDDSHLRLQARPVGRDTAQRLRIPDPLYKTTEPLSMGGILRNWDRLLD